MRVSKGETRCSASLLSMTEHRHYEEHAPVTLRSAQSARLEGPPVTLRSAQSARLEGRDAMLRIAPQHDRTPSP